MDIAFEFARAVIATVSRRCTTFLIESASRHPRFRKRLINVGHATNHAYVHLKYFGRLWLYPQKGPHTQEKEGELRITLNVKSLDEEKALEVGADTVAEVAVLLIMLCLVSVGLLIRRVKAAEAGRCQRARDEELLRRIELLETRVLALQKGLSGDDSSHSQE